MKFLWFAVLLPLLLGCAHRPASVPLASARARAALECEVWQRELSFARSVAAHDAAAFAEHVHPDAVFRPSIAKAMRGRQAIAAGWKGLIAGESATVLWYPTQVRLGPDGRSAWSSGPSLWRTRDAQGQWREELGAFHSLWFRDADGAWRVFFDDGGEIPATDAAAIAAFHAGRREACPAP